MVRRMVEEASLMARDNATTITPDASNTRCVLGGLVDSFMLRCTDRVVYRSWRAQLFRWLCLQSRHPTRINTLASTPNFVNPFTSYAFVWLVGNWDAHDGASTLVGLYTAELLGAYSRERVLHIMLLVVAILSMGAFVVFLFRPFVAAVRKEGRRVAELLVQLPQEVDLETLVTALTDTGAEGGEGAKRSPSRTGGFGVPQGYGGGMMQGWAGSAAGQGSMVQLLGSGDGGGGGGVRQQAWGGGDGSRGFGPGEQQMVGFHAGSYAGNYGPASGDGVRRRSGVGRRVAPELG
jgi:hypothetical protein